MSTTLRSSSHCTCRPSMNARVATAARIGSTPGASRPSSASRLEHRRRLLARELVAADEVVVGRMLRRGRLGRQRACRARPRRGPTRCSSARRTSPRSPTDAVRVRRSRRTRSDCSSRRSSTAARRSLLFLKWCRSPASLMPTRCGDLSQRARPVARFGEDLERGIEDRLALRAGLRVLAARLARPGMRSRCPSSSSPYLSPEPSMDAASEPILCPLQTKT